MEVDIRMSREEKIYFIIDSVRELMGVDLERDEIKALELMSDEELDKEVEWMEYLWTK